MVGGLKVRKKEGARQGEKARTKAVAKANVKKREQGRETEKSRVLVRCILRVAGRWPSGGRRCEKTVDGY